MAFTDPKSRLPKPARSVTDIVSNVMMIPKRTCPAKRGSARLALAQALAEERGGKWFEARLRTMVSRGENPGALAGMVKLAYATRLQKTNGLAMELRGLDAIAPHKDDATTRAIHYDYIWSTVMRIAGGADEVLKNQIAERVLGMPGDVRMDKGVAFEDLKG